MRLAVIVCAVIVASACGGGSPTSPTPTLPQIAGQWTGSYTITSCVETAPVGACAGLGGGGPHSLTPSQNGGTITGQLGIGVFSIPISGSIDTAGLVTVAGSGPVSTAQLTVNTWRATVNGSTMTGTMTYTVSAEGVLVTVNATTALLR